MNAYELADEIQAKYHMMGFPEEAVIMLRQQADRIAELEKWEERWSKRCQRQQDRIAELEKQLAFMEGEYPEPTIAEKMTEFKDLEQAYNRIAELEKQVKHWTTPCQPLCKPSVCDCITPPTRQLSDEEIWEVIERPELWDDNGVLRSCIDFARAIEAKVREEK
jgi:hypothetical protein